MAGIIGILPAIHCVSSKTQYRARRSLNNTRKVAPQVAERCLNTTSSNNNEVRTTGFGGLPDDCCHVSQLNRDFAGSPDALLQRLDLPQGRLPEKVVESPPPTGGARRAGNNNGMDQMNGGSADRSYVSSHFKHMEVFSGKIDGAHNIANRREMTGRLWLFVTHRQHRAAAIMQDLRRYGAEQKPAERTPAMCRHSDQIGALPFRIMHNRVRRLTVHNGIVGIV